MKSHSTIFVMSAVVALVLANSGCAKRPDWIRVGPDGKSFVMEKSGLKFVAWGVNYDRDEAGRFIEDYWDKEWATIEQDFAEMKQLGANVVRIHLQYGKFMVSPDKPNEHSLRQLARLVALAERTGLYLDLTGLACYHKQDVPVWYRKMSEEQRWAAQTHFWEAVASTCADSPAIFCYDLMNEPVVPAGNKQQTNWLGGELEGNYYVQFITRNAKDRPRHEIARGWIELQVAAIRKHDRRHMITVGMLDWSLDRPGLTSGFIPDKVSGKLDFIAVHIYPQKGKVGESIDTLKGFAAVGKPVVIEEMFPLACNAQELGEFIELSRPYAAGWIGFYWGKTPDEYRKGKTIGEAITLSWLELFQEKGKTIR